MADTPPPPGLASAHRIEALTDGIFAVAMTLLVIELKVPPHLEVDSEAFFQAIADQVPRFVSWLVSFFVLSFFWLGNQRVFSYVRHVDGPLAALTLAFLAAATLIPFSSALSGEYGGAFVSQATYRLTIAPLRSAALAVLRYAHRHPELGHPAPYARYLSARLRIGGLIVVSGLAAAIAWYVPHFGNVAFLLMAVINPLSRRFE